MTLSFIGRTTSVDQLKASLDVSAKRTRAIADRVARASAGQDEFALPAGPDGMGGSEGPVNVEAEMVNLADEQLRYEAAAKFLQKTYAGLRESLQSK
ncbi:MAG: hypothetical protein ACHQQ3_00075 [Gemmatimonadales bacterium]